MSSIPSRLLASYRSTVYRVYLEKGSLTFRVGRDGRAVDAFLRSLDKHHGVFVTAWNPRSRPMGRRANEAALRRLKARLERAGCRVLDAVGEGPSWREPSVFAAGLSRAQGGAVGRRYRQNAVLYVAVRRPVELVLLR